MGKESQKSDERRTIVNPNLTWLVAGMTPADLEACAAHLEETRDEYQKRQRKIRESPLMRSLLTHPMKPINWEKGLGAENDQEEL